MGMHVGQEDTQGGERARNRVGAAREKVGKVSLSPLEALDKGSVIGRKGADGCREGIVLGAKAGHGRKQISLRAGRATKGGLFVRGVTRGMPLGKVPGVGGAAVARHPMPNAAGGLKRGARHCGPGGRRVVADGRLRDGPDWCQGPSRGDGGAGGGRRVAGGKAAWVVQITVVAMGVVVVSRVSFATSWPSGAVGFTRGRENATRPKTWSLLSGEAGTTGASTPRVSAGALVAEGAGCPVVAPGTPWPRSGPAASALSRRSPE